MSNEVIRDCITDELIAPGDLITIHSANFSIGTLVDYYCSSDLEEPLNPCTRQPLPDDLKERVLAEASKKEVTVVFSVEGVGDYAVVARSARELGWFIGELFNKVGIVPVGYFGDKSLYMFLGDKVPGNRLITVTDSHFTESFTVFDVKCIESYLVSHPTYHRGLVCIVHYFDQVVVDHTRRMMELLIVTKHDDAVLEKCLRYEASQDLIWAFLEPSANMTLTRITKLLNTYESLLDYFNQLACISTAAITYNDSLVTPYRNRLATVIRLLQAYKRPTFILDICRYKKIYRIAIDVIDKALTKMVDVGVSVSIEKLYAMSEGNAEHHAILIELHRYFCTQLNDPVALITQTPVTPENLLKGLILFQDTAFLIQLYSLKLRYPPAVITQLKIIAMTDSSEYRRGAARRIIQVSNR